MERVRNLNAHLQIVLITASSEPADRWVDRIEPFFNQIYGVHFWRASSLAWGWVAQDRCTQTTLASSCASVSAVSRRTVVRSSDT